MTDSRHVELPYSPDSSDLAARLQSLDCPVFLDSCRHNSPAHRYDILSAMPSASVAITEGNLSSTLPLPGHARQDAFAAIRYLMSHAGYDPDLKEGGDSTSLPFPGGLLGFLGYPRLTGHGSWRIEQAFFGYYPWALVVDHQRQRNYLNFLPDCPDSTRQRVLEALAGRPPGSTPFQLRESFHSDMSPAEYQAAFDRIMGYIDAGDAYQVNLTQRFSSHFDGDPFNAYRRLRALTGKPFSAFLRWGNSAILSLSPERFLRVDSRQAVTQPIKGTRPRSADPATDLELARDLQGSEKDRAENLMIVDLLRNDLGTICQYGSVKVEQLFALHSFDNVHHLVSTVTGTLRDGMSPLRLLETCFPGGSVTGAPKIRAMEIIEALEPTPRDAYCGTVFYLGVNGRLDSNLTIRTLSCRGDQVFCWAGGGIVADSQPDQEYAECFDKIRSIISALEGLA